ncbi:MAG: head-tail adaptor protein [Lachnospiraceae bacterium]|nr:head-tail adaptor protein [Lachnospiraceae bacterium]
MNLIEKMMEEYCFVNKTKVKDGAGGFNVEWNDGKQFSAAVIRDTTMEARRAEQAGVSSVYTVTTSRNIVLKYHDVIKRLSDGRIFRITSDGGDKTSPMISTLDMSQVMAEKWELTT